jgi:Predicted membrane protein
MSEQHTPPPVSGRETDKWLSPGKPNVQAIYVLYLVGFVIGITALIGIVLAYMNRGKSEAWVETHYTYAIRTFWIGMVGAIVSFFLLFLLIGFPLMFAVAVWVIVRCIFGLQQISRNEPIARPEGWWI